MHPSLVRHVALPLHEWVKRKPTFRWLRRLERSQWVPPEEMQGLQWSRLREHLRFAGDHVPYYRRLFGEHGIDPARVRTPADLERIPCMTRDVLRSEFDDLRARVRLPRVVRRTSGGSTGEPAAVLSDMERMGFGEAVRLRAHRWFGLEPGAREVWLWGSPIELGRQDRMRRLRDRLLNSVVLSAFDMDERRMAEYGRVIQTFRPHKMVVYAYSMYALARYLEETGWMAPARLRAIFTTAETLFGFQREAIRRVFGASVAVEYGARDAGLMANECPAGRLHVAAEGILLEIQDAGPDGLGEIVVTNLYSAAMPIIRYRTGDLGELATEACPCGRTLPVLRRLEGRQSDLLVTPDGRLMHPLALIYVLRDSPGIRAFQIVQESTRELTVRIAPAPDFSEATRRAVSAGVQRRMGPEVRVEIELVDSITPSASGKHRFVISKVAQTRVDARAGALR